MKPTIMKSMTLRALWWFRWGAVVTVLAGLVYWIIWSASEEIVQTRNAGNGNRQCIEELLPSRNRCLLWRR